MKLYDVIIIGAGQAGLAMGYYLNQTNLAYIILDSEDRIGNSWRKRYHSLVLFTPRSYSSLPGFPMVGPSHGYPTKDDYLSPLSLPPGPVLVVGGGNSGAQIAVELSEIRQVTLSTSTSFKFLPLAFMGKSIFKWLELAGLLHAGIDTIRGKWFRNRPDPLFGYDLKHVLKQGKVTSKPKVVDGKIDEVLFADGSRQKVRSIIWSTGFIPSFHWVDIEGALASSGKPLHDRGVSPIEGLFYIGLPWQYQRGSALICGVGRDAEYLLEQMR